MTTQVNSGTAQARQGRLRSAQAGSGWLRLAQACSGLLKRCSGSKPKKEIRRLGIGIMIWPYFNIIVVLGIVGDSLQTPRCYVAKFCHPQAGLRLANYAEM
jgi:hypothetical protein